MSVTNWRKWSMLTSAAEGIISASFLCWQLSLTALNDSRGPLRLQLSCVVKYWIPGFVQLRAFFTNYFFAPAESEVATASTLGWCMIITNGGLKCVYHLIRLESQWTVTFQVMCGFDKGLTYVKCSIQFHLQLALLQRCIENRPFRYKRNNVWRN